MPVACARQRAKPAGQTPSSPRCLECRVGWHGRLASAVVRSARRMPVPPNRQALQDYQAEALHDRYDRQNPQEAAHEVRVSAGVSVKCWQRVLR